MMNIHTVAAGGGSILAFDGARMRVGPESAGADPGPACYGRGGPLAVTDANVLTGRLRPEFFPAIFGPGGDRPLDAAAARARLRGAGGGDRPAGRRRWPRASCRIAVENMANAIKKISVQRGYDVLGLLPDGVRRRRGAACLRHRRHARHARPASSIRWPRCSRPTAWGSPTSAPPGRRRSRRRSTREGRLAAAALLDALGVDGRTPRSRRRGSRRGTIRLRQTLHLKVKGTDTALPVASTRSRRCGPPSRRRTGRGSASIPARRRSSSRRCRPRRSASPPTSTETRGAETRAAGGGDRDGAERAGLSRRRLGRGPLRPPRGAPAGGHG